MARAPRALAIILFGVSMSWSHKDNMVSAFSTSKLQLPDQNNLQRRTKEDSTERYTWLLPPSAGLFGVLTFESTRDLFHVLIDMASRNTWEAVDGGRMGGELLVPILNGPISLGVSIIFATLAAMTIQTMFSRQMDIHLMLVLSMEEARDLFLKVDAFSEPYKTSSNEMLRTFVVEILEDFQAGSITTETLRDSRLADFHCY